MQVYLNQKETEVPEGTTVKGLLDRQQIAAEGTAIAIDNKLVPKSEWDNRTLAPCDKITLIRATFGG